eukprot:6203144-Pleurochrysis_carterae.AAC.2
MRCFARKIGGNGRLVCHERCACLSRVLATCVLCRCIACAWVSKHRQQITERAGAYEGACVGERLHAPSAKCVCVQVSDLMPCRMSRCSSVRLFSVRLFEPVRVSDWAKTASTPA